MKRPHYILKVNDTVIKSFENLVEAFILLDKAEGLYTKGHTLTLMDSNKVILERIYL